MNLLNNNTLIDKGDKRSIKVYKNIAVGFVVKVLSVLITFFCVPITLGYLNAYEYGIWLTLNSVLSWISLTDIGLGQGLRNNLTNALAINDMKEAKSIISTAYISFWGILLCVFSVFIIIFKFVNWYSLLNVNQQLVSNLDNAVLLSFVLICVNFFFKLLTNIFQAYQMPSINDVIGLISSFVAFCCIWILTKLSTNGNLMYVAMIFLGSPIIINIIATIVTFKVKKEITPSFKSFDKRHIKSLYSLGIKFFLIQIASIVIFTTSNLIISKMFGPQDVTPYNIAYKYMTLLTIGFTIIVTPYWSAVTDALAKGDINWIKQSIYRLHVCWIISVFCAIIMVLFSPIFYRLWIGNTININIFLTILCSLYACISNWNNIYAYLIAGSGKLAIQLILSTIQGLLFIPLAITLGKIFGISGIPLALCLTLILSSIIPVVQFHKIINNTAFGIWYR